MVSWYVMMGIGQVVTLRVPAERLREVNRAIEQTAWGAATAPNFTLLTTIRISASILTPKHWWNEAASGVLTDPPAVSLMCLLAGAPARFI